MKLFRFDAWSSKGMATLVSTKLGGVGDLMGSFDRFRSDTSLRVAWNGRWRMKEMRRTTEQRNAVFRYLRRAIERLDRDQSIHKNMRTDLRGVPRRSDIPLDSFMVVPSPLLLAVPHPEAISLHPILELEASFSLLRAYAVLSLLRDFIWLCARQGEPEQEPTERKVSLVPPLLPKRDQSYVGNTRYEHVPRDVLLKVSGMMLAIL